MCNELKCAIQSTVDLININITRDVQEDIRKGTRFSLKIRITGNTACRNL